MQIEELEILATELEQNAAAQRNRLLRLCRLHVRILASREPALFERRATWHGDEEGHFDSSYPPKQVYRDHTGPRTIHLAARVTEDVATSGGFYFDWRRVTSYGGLHVRGDGRFLRSVEEGTGRVGQFAAHPGDTNVSCTITWSSIPEDDLSLDELTAAEKALRALAFPAPSGRLTHPSRAH